MLAAVPPATVVAGGALLAGAGMTLAESVWSATLQRQVPGAALSRVISYDWFGSLALSPLGLVVLGPVATLLGIGAARWLDRGRPRAPVGADR